MFVPLAVDSFCLKRRLRKNMRSFYLQNVFFLYSYVCMCVFIASNRDINKFNHGLLNLTGSLLLERNFEEKKRIMLNRLFSIS